jgi:hypothetical protein
MRTLLTLAVVALVATACNKPNPEAEAFLAEKTAHVARHAQVDSVAKVWLAAVTPELAKPLYAEGAMMYSPDAPQGQKASEYHAQTAEMMKAFADMKMEANVTRVGDDFFAIAGTMSAKYSGPANPMDPKSKVVKDAPIGGPWVALVIVNEAGKITEERSMWDNMSIASQLEAAAKKK